MANEFVVSAVIGASLSSTFAAAFGSAKKTTEALGRVADDLGKRHERVGAVMARALAHPTRSLQTLRTHYEKLGGTIEKLKLHQEKLNASIARGKALGERRKELRGEMMEVGGTAAALGAPIVKSIMSAMSHQDQMRDLRITANLGAGQEESLSRAIRTASSGSGQSAANIGAVVREVLAGGASAHQAESYAGLIGETMLALRTSDKDTAGAILALHDMGISDQEGMQRSLDRLVAIGQQGQMNPALMVQAFAGLGDTIKQAKMSGEKSIGQLAAGLQVAEGTMGAQGAVAAQKSWLESMAAPTRIAEAYKNAGLDYAASMAQHQKKGLSQYEASIEIANAFIDHKLSKKDKQALQAGDKDGRVAEMLEQMGMGAVFKDANAARYALEIGRNRARYDALLGTQAGGGMKAIADLRRETATATLGDLMVEVSDVAKSIGDALLPVLVDTVRTVKPVIQGFGAWAKENPGVIKGVVGLVGGLLVGKMAVIGLQYGFNLLLTPFNTAKTLFHLVGAKTSLFNAMLLRSGGALRFVGQAALWLGRMLMMNPIGLLIGGIGLAAYLIYKYWGPIKGFFAGVWNRVKEAFSGGIGGVSRLILDWSPIGLFYNSFARVLSWFGVELPANFSDFGSMLIDGLVSGITGKLSAAREAIVNFGLNIKGWFADTLGIQSPSRVFVGLGENIGAGAALGIDRSGAQAARAAAALADTTASSAQGFGGAAPSGRGFGAGGINVHFAPQITVQGGAGDIGGAVLDATRMSLADLERMLTRILAQQARKMN